MLVLAMVLGSSVVCLAAPRPLVVQLKWRHQFQFAGCYAALAQGYYQEAGLDVRLQDWDGAEDPVATVLAGKADVGISAANILEARLAGKPVVVLASIFQRSPLVLLALKSSGISTPQDVAGRRVSITRHSDLELWAMLRQAGVRVQDVVLQDGLTTRMEELLAGKVDAISGYQSSEVVALQQRGLDPVILRPSTYDIEFYGDSLFTTEPVLAARREELEAFVQATIKGWEYALAHPDQLVDLILSRYAPEADRRTLLQEAEGVRRLIAPGRAPIGATELVRWKAMAEELMALGIAGDVSRVEHMTHVPGAPRSTQLRQLLIGIGAVAGVAVLVALGLLVANRRLVREMQRRRRAEAEARETGALLEGMLAQLPVAMFRLNSRREVLFSRGQGLRRLGLEDDALIGRRLDLVFPEFAERLAQFKAGEVTSFLMQGGSQDHPWQLETYMFQDKDGCLTGFSLDTTPVMQAEQERARLVQLIESTPDITYMADAAGRVLYLNTAGRAFYELESLAGSQLLIPMLHPSDVGRRIVAEAIPTALREGVWMGETTLRNWRGQERPVSQAIIAHREADGAVLRLSTICRDLSKRIQMEAELKEATRVAQSAFRAKSEFLAHMSHEIRTPLNGMLGMLQLLTLTSLTEEQREYVDTGLNSGRGLVTILSDILDLSRVESGRLTLEEKPLNVRALVDEVAILFEKQAQDKGIAFKVWVDPATPDLILGDAGRLRQVLFNLLGNAVKFTLEGEVTLEVVALRDSAQAATLTAPSAPPSSLPVDLPLEPDEPAGVVLVFQISDTGPGIPAKEIPLLFEAFQQKPVPGKDGKLQPRRGAGLGLAVVARLVKLMGGSVQVLSQPGEGAEFTVTIPCATLPPSRQEQTEEDEAGGMPWSLRILLAEDEPTNRFTMETFLNRCGHRVVTVEDGAAALVVARRQPFDLILLDIQLPQVSGVDVARQLREEGDTTPIVAISAFAMPGDRERFLEAGMNSYLSKPLDFKVLDAVLRTYALG